MSQESEHPATDSPAFVPSPNLDPPASSRPAGDASPVAATPPPPPTQAREATASTLSNVILMVVGGALAAGGYGLARMYAPPRPPGEVAGLPATDAVKPDDFKALSDRFDGMKASLDQISKQASDRPDPTLEVRSQKERLDSLAQTVGELPARFDSINQKLETINKQGGSGSSPRVDELDKKVANLSQTLESLKADRRATAASTGSVRVDGANPEAQAMEQAAELYKAKKYAEAKDAFNKLQATYPNDARVWYYSALANGFATGQWRGETERMVNRGLEKEKANQPDSSKVDALFSGLTTATGKEWLAEYRQRIGAR